MSRTRSILLIRKTMFHCLCFRLIFSSLESFYYLTFCWSTKLLSLYTSRRSFLFLSCYVKNDRTHSEKAGSKRAKNNFRHSFVFVQHTLSEAMEFGVLFLVLTLRPIHSLSNRYVNLVSFSILLRFMKNCFPKFTLCPL